MGGDGVIAHTVPMATRTASHRRPGAAVCHCIVAILIAAGALLVPIGALADERSSADDSTAEAEAVGADEPTVTIESVRFEADHSVSGYIGGRVPGTVYLTIKNWTAETYRDVVPEVSANGTTVFVAPLSIEPFGVVDTTAQLELAGPSWTLKRITASVLGVDATTDHRTIPWMSLALAAIVTNCMLLACRNMIRDSIRERVAQHRPDPGTVQPGQ